MRLLMASLLATESLFKHAERASLSPPERNLNAYTTMKTGKVPHKCKSGSLKKGVARRALNRSSVA